MTGDLLGTLLILWAAACLVWAAAVDLRERRIPNGAVLALAIGSLAQMALAAGGAPVLSALSGAGERLACAAVLVAATTAFECFWRASRGGVHGIGMGDVKLLGACALWVGAAVLIVVALACLVALCCELPRRRLTFAFGPYIALAFGACLLVTLEPQATLPYVLELPLVHIGLPLAA